MKGRDEMEHCNVKPLIDKNKISVSDYAEVLDLLQEASDVRYTKGCCPKYGDQCEWHQRLWDITH